MLSLTEAPLLMGATSAVTAISVVSSGFQTASWKRSLRVAVVREEIPGAVAKGEAALSGELHGDGVVLIVGRSRGIEAQLVGGVAVVDDAGKGAGKFTGAADGASAGGRGHFANGSLDGMQILAHLGGDAAGLHVAAAALGGASGRCGGRGVVGRGLGELDVAVLDVGGDGVALKLRDIEGVHRRVRIVHGFLRVQGKGFGVFGCLSMRRC